MHCINMHNVPIHSCKYDKYTCFNQGLALVIDMCMHSYFALFAFASPFAYVYDVDGEDLYSIYTARSFMMLLKRISALYTPYKYAYMYLYT
jgi:hypothetical protein